MINVGFLTANHFPRLGGMEFAVHFLVEALNKKDGVSAAVACGTMREILKDFSYPYPCYRAKSLSFLTPWFKRLNELSMIRNEKINLLHGPMLHGGGFDAMQLSKKKGIPFVAQSHGADVQTVPEIQYGGTLIPEAKKMVQSVLKNADHLIAVSSFNKNCMVDLGAAPEKITIVPNGILFPEIQETPYLNLREKLKINPDDFLIITVGRNRPVKRMELLFAALEKLKEYKKIKCLCVGPIENLAESIQKFGLENKVILTGNLPTTQHEISAPPYMELVNAYRAANLYISTSYVESFGSATADALACGIPVIIGKNHGVCDILKENQTGWIMKKETPKELAEMILELSRQREQLINKSQEIKNSVSWLTWGHVADQMIETYRDLNVG